MMLLLSVCLHACDDDSNRDEGSATTSNSAGQPESLAPLPDAPGLPPGTPALGTPLSVWTENDERQLVRDGLAMQLHVDGAGKVSAVDVTVGSEGGLGEELENKWGTALQTPAAWLWFAPAQEIRVALPATSTERRTGTLRVERYRPLEALVRVDGRFAFEPPEGLLGAASDALPAAPGTESDGERMLAIRPVAASNESAIELEVDDDGVITAFQLVVRPRAGGADAIHRALGVATDGIGLGAVAPAQVTTLTRKGQLYRDPSSERRMLLAERLDATGAYDLEIERYLPLATVAGGPVALDALRERALEATPSALEMAGEHAFELPATDWDPGPTRGRVVTVAESPASEGEAVDTPRIRVERIELELGFALRRAAKDEIRARFERALGLQSLGKARVGDGKRLELGGGAALSETIAGDEWLLELAPRWPEVPR